MKIHDLQRALLANSPTTAFTPPDILRKLTPAIEEVDATLASYRGARAKAKPNGNRTPRHIEETVCYLRAKGYTKKEVAERLDVPQSTVTKICEREGVA